MPPASRYARQEIERRWLLACDAAPLIAGSEPRTITDLYVTGTRMRLRHVTGPGPQSTYKFGRKDVERGSPHRWVTNFYISAAEYEVLSRLDGCRVEKLRYPLEGGSLDLYPGGGSPVIFETEFDSLAAAQAYKPPSFAGREITGDESYSGAALAACVDAASGHAPDLLRHRISAGVLVERDNKLLLVHCQKPGVYDFWVAPGGGANGAEDLWATAKREALEESGLEVEPGQLVYVEEFHSPLTRYCKLWFRARATGGTLDVSGRDAASEFITEAAFLSREEIAARISFPAFLADTYWQDKAQGFASSPRYLGIRAMAVW